MEHQACHRCDKSELIPTYQFIKVDDHLHYLCESCWTIFRSWLLWEKEAEPPRQRALC